MAAIDHTRKEYHELRNHRLVDLHDDDRLQAC